MHTMGVWSLRLQCFGKLILAIACAVYLWLEWDYLGTFNLASASPALAFWDGRLTIIAFGIGFIISGISDLKRAASLKAPERPEDRAAISAHALLTTYPPQLSEKQPKTISEPIVDSQNMLFLSYSRRQFYFAESLVLHLQKRGISVWFDVQQLVPGKHWQAGIQAGLDESKALILIASRAALESPYVQLEWEAALKNNKAVTIVAFEDFILPPALKAAPIIDFRGAFEPALNRLIETLNGTKVYHDAIPQANAFGIPTKVPPAIRLILSALFMVFVCSALSSALAFTDFATTRMGDFMVMNFNLFFYRFSALLILPLLLIVAWKLLRREMSGSSQALLGTVFSFIFSTYNVMALFTLFYMALQFSRGEAVNWAWLVFVIGWLGLLLLFGLAWLNNRYLLSADLLRWSTTGMVTQEYRLRVNAPLLHIQPQAIGQRARAASYTLFYQAEDTAIAKRLHEGLKAASYAEAAPNIEADYPMVLISNLSAKEQLLQLMEKYPSQLVCVLAANITLPDELKALQNYQWVDFRSRNMPKLVSSLHYLGEARENRRAAFSLDLLPESLALPIIPQETAQLLMTWRATGAFCIAVALLGILFSYIFPTANIPAFFWWLPLFSMGLVFMLLDEALRRRLAGFRFAYFAAIAFSLLAALLPLLHSLSALVLISLVLLFAYHFYNLPMLLTVMRQGGLPKGIAATTVLGASRLRPAWQVYLAFILALSLIMGLVIFVMTAGVVGLPISDWMAQIF